MKLTIASGCLLLMLSGCATELKTFSSTGATIPGVPVPKPMMVKVVTTTTYTPIVGADRPELCESPLVTESYDYIASGDYYYATVEPSKFANGSFEINFNDKGIASKIALNSDASTGLDSVNSLLGTLLPYYQAPKVDELQAKASADTSSRLAQNGTPSAAELKAARCVIERKTVELKRMPRL